MEMHMTRYVTPEEFAEIRSVAGWRMPTMHQAENLIKRSAVAVIRDENEKLCAFARSFGDGGMIWTLADVFVMPQYRHTGLGKQVVEELMSDMQASLQHGERATIFVMSSVGGEAFYEKMGFTIHPQGDVKGAGATLYIDHKKY